MAINHLATYDYRVFSRGGFSSARCRAITCAWFPKPFAACRLCSVLFSYLLSDFFEVLNGPCHPVFLQRFGQKVGRARVDRPHDGIPLHNG
ncbi:hypothetical protein BSPP4475_16100 [Brevibacillus aydinogluensis]|uniref:Uncharacterized protein n=1 Tax=Brevibacillus aydinogluensis TaxID=927786 RepID=A0AA48RDC7_9BACL|nr:hypothetical protein BSPP4475_16100 [Brevibacillus aydinogluensis]